MPPSTRNSAFFNICKDPFNAPAAAITDSYSGHTLPLKIRQSIYITTSAAGHGSIFLVGGLSDFYRIGTMTGTTTAYGALQNHEDYANLQTNSKLWRPVSMGVSAHYVGTESTASGEILFYPTQGLTLTDFPLDISSWRDIQNVTSKTIPFQQKPISAALTPFDSPPFAGLATNFGSFFPWLGIGVIGAPANLACIRVDVVYNIELLPLPASIHHHLAVQAPADTVAMDSVARRLSPVRIDPDGPEAVVAQEMNTAARQGDARNARMARRRAKPAALVKFRPNLMIRPGRYSRAATRYLQKKSLKARKRRYGGMSDMRRRGARVY